MSAIYFNVTLAFKSRPVKKFLFLWLSKQTSMRRVSCLHHITHITHFWLIIIVGKFIWTAQIPSNATFSFLCYLLFPRSKYCTQKIILEYLQTTWPILFCLKYNKSYFGPSSWFTLFYTSLSHNYKHWQIFIPLFLSVYFLPMTRKYQFNWKSNFSKICTFLY